MTFKLTKTERKEIDGLLQALLDAHALLDNAVLVYNEALTAAHTELQPHVEAYNGAASDLVGYVNGLAEEHDEEWNNRSEKWQEGEAGSAAQSWIESLRIEIDECDIDAPDEITLDLPDGSEITIEDQPEEQ